MTHDLTAEQNECIHRAVAYSDNILISALAGAAKTSTLEEIAKALPNTQILCLAFNKKIAQEMGDRLPPNCQSKTLNSLGLSAWRDTMAGRLVVDINKNNRLFRAIVDGATKKEAEALWYSMGYILQSVRLAKASGHIPDDAPNHGGRLMNDAELFDSLEDEPTIFQFDIILSVLKSSLEEAHSGRIDFDDMLLMPTIFRAIFPRMPLVMVDEAQDLSPLNHAMLKKLCKRRLIAVGDQCQAIYAFRGAHSNGIAELRSQFDMTELTLSTTFRCPEEIVDHVRWRAPHMKSWDKKPAGSVRRHTTWSVEDIPDGAAIICRNNAPLFNMAVTLLRNGRYPNLWGNDIAAGMIKQLKKFGPSNMKRDSVLQEIKTWEEEKLKKTRHPRNILDRVECLRIFAREAEDLAGAIKYAQHIFDAQGPVQLLTGHKSKGHQFNDVYFLDEHLVRDEGQDPNLRYVICTRAEQNLHYINTDSCLERMDDED